MARTIDLVTYFVLLGFVTGILFFSYAGCGLGANGRQITAGDGEGGSGGGDGRIQDLGTFYNNQLPGTNVERGRAGDLWTTSALGQGIIVIDSDSEEGTWKVKNKLHNPTGVADN